MNKVVIAHNPLNGVILCVKGSSGVVFPEFGEKAPTIVIEGGFLRAGFKVAAGTAETIFAGPDVSYISYHLVGTVRPRADAAFALEIRVPQDVLDLVGDTVPEEVKQYIQSHVRSWQKKST